MRILALDSSGLVASVALVEEDRLTAEYTINYKKTHSQTLLPMLDEILGMTELELATVDAIAVACGPGSFTGLRIGSATAKGLGLALDKPLIPVSTLEALAFNLYSPGVLVCPMMDARRQQVYTALYRMTEGRPEVVLPPEAVGVKELLEKLNKQGEAVVFLGDGVPVYEQLIREELQVSYSFAPSHVNRQRAGAVGALAHLMYKEGIFQSAEAHRPEYLRLSQAEREKKEREKGGLA